MRTTGITWVTPSPESMTVPVKVFSVTCLEVQEAARASTACTAIYSPGTLNVSNMISAVYSLFSGALRGGSVYKVHVSGFALPAKIYLKNINRGKKTTTKERKK